MSVTVVLTATTRSEAVRAAAERAAAWFEEDLRCIAVDLGDVTTNTLLTVLTVRATAIVRHEWTRQSSGFPRCRHCDKVSYREPR